MRRRPLPAYFVRRVKGGSASGEVKSWAQLASAYSDFVPKAAMRRLRAVVGDGKVLEIGVVEVHRDGPLRVGRRRGIGRRLVAIVERAGRRRGATSAALIASRLEDRDRYPAGFWKKMGYSRISLRARSDGVFARRLNPSPLATRRRRAPSRRTPRATICY